MKMIIGGAFQGKSNYVKQIFPEISWEKGREITLEELLSCKGVTGFHEFIRKEMKSGKNVSGLASLLIQNNPEIIIVSDEVGYGVVPMDAFERAYREQVGRTCTELAGFSNKVIRVVCGIGTVIKNA